MLLRQTCDRVGHWFPGPHRDGVSHKTILGGRRGDLPKPQQRGNLQRGRNRYIHSIYQQLLGHGDFPKALLSHLKTWAEFERRLRLLQRQFLKETHVAKAFGL